MYAAGIINDTMSLDEKLAAIDAAMAVAIAQSNKEFATPIDPSTLAMCEGCQ